ncbi:hypothetical protein C0J52_27444 [Blattella germanica]|nr:hypothetical protein C0J52_27444 [Blattella germanica]
MTTVLRQHKRCTNLSIDGYMVMAMYQPGELKKGRLQKIWFQDYETDLRSMGMRKWKETAQQRRDEPISGTEHQHRHPTANSHSLCLQYSIIAFVGTSVMLSDSEEQSHKMRQPEDVLGTLLLAAYELEEDEMDVKPAQVLHWHDEQVGATPC